MGFKTIEAQYNKDVAEYRNTTGRFVEAAKLVNAKLAELKQKKDLFTKLGEEVAFLQANCMDGAHALDPQGDIQFSEIKKLLINASEHGEPHPINLAELASLDKIEGQMKAEMNKKMAAHLDKLAAAWPAELKQGMLFLKKANGDLAEILAPPTTVRGASGDTIVIKVKYTSGLQVIGGQEKKMTGVDLSVQKGWRFVKT